MTLAERGEAPLDDALGGVWGVAADMQREARRRPALWRHELPRSMETGTDVYGEPSLSDGTTLDVDVAVVALGAVRNVEWLRRRRIGRRAAGCGL